jgi:hypothetical protein
LGIERDYKQKGKAQKKNVTKETSDNIDKQ